MYREDAWRTVHELHRNGETKAGIARKLSMSRTTVARLLSLDHPPAYRSVSRISDESLTRLAQALIAFAEEQLAQRNEFTLPNPVGRTR